MARPRVKKPAGATRRRSFEYLTEPDSALKCHICKEVAVRPLQEVSCGKLFCTKCLQRYGRRRRCPSCGETRPFYFADTRGRISIQGLPVKCNDCSCEVLAGDLQEHWAKCDYVLLPCPKKSKKKILFTKKDLAKHLENDCPDRDLECEEEGSCTHVHESNCDKKLTIACPNSDCTEVVALQDAKKHLEECDYSEIQCKYQKLGCSTKLPRKDILSHEENDQLHLRMALNSINSTVLNKQESMTFKVTEFTTKKDSNTVFYSPTFYSSQNGYHFQVAVYANGLCDGVGEFVSIYLYLIKGRCDEKLNWPMVANVWFEILNQTQDSDHHRQKMSITVKDNMVVGRFRVGCWFQENSQEVSQAISEEISQR